MAAAAAVATAATAAAGAPGPAGPGAAASTPSSGSAAPGSQGVLIGDRLYSGVLITLENCLLPDDKLRFTPSMSSGLDTDTETDLRVVGCELIQAAGILLRLPQVRAAREPREGNCRAGAMGFSGPFVGGRAGPTAPTRYWDPGSSPAPEHTPTCSLRAWAGSPMVLGNVLSIDCAENPSQTCNLMVKPLKL